MVLTTHYYICPEGFVGTNTRHLTRFRWRRMLGNKIEKEFWPQGVAEYPPAMSLRRTLPVAKTMTKWTYIQPGDRMVDFAGESSMRIPFQQMNLETYSNDTRTEKSISIQFIATVPLIIRNLQMTPPMVYKTSRAVKFWYPKIDDFCSSWFKITFQICAMGWRRRIKCSIKVILPFSEINLLSQ